MRIGIDIDDVMTDTSLAMREYIEKYDQNGEISEHMEEVMRGEIPNEQVKKFFEENIVRILKNAKLKDHVREVMERLMQNGNEIYIITARGENKFKGSEAVTLSSFQEKHIPYTKILFNSYEKANLCQENRIDVMVDDSIKHCLAVKEKQITSILFASSVNQEKKVEIETVDNWLDLEEKINEIKK